MIRLSADVKANVNVKQILLYIYTLAIYKYIYNIY